MRDTGICKAKKSKGINNEGLWRGMFNKQLIHERRRLKLTPKWLRSGLADQERVGSMGFDWGGFGEATIHEEEGQNFLLKADTALQVLLVT